MNEKEQLIEKLKDCEFAYTTAKSHERWDEAQEAAEAMMNLCRRLSLLEIQTKAEQKGTIV